MVSNAGCHRTFQKFNKDKSEIGPYKSGSQKAWHTPQNMKQAARNDDVIFVAGTCFDAQVKNVQLKCVSL